MDQESKTKYNRNVKCFAMGCSNKITSKRNRLHFFRVPDGIEGLFWTKAVKQKQRNYEQLIEHLSNSTSEQTFSKSNPQTESNNIEYCCEDHFNINTDMEKIIDGNGSVEYKIKPGVFPSLKAKQTKSKPPVESEVNSSVKTKKKKRLEKRRAKRLQKAKELSVYLDEKPQMFEIHEITSDEDSPSNTTQDYHMETNHIYDQQEELNYEPLMPLTVALMKRKPLLYLGLEESSLSRLLEMSTDLTPLTELKIMLTLRKLCLNEQFEILGDIFDIDKATAEQYFQEYKTLVSDLADALRISNLNNSDTTYEIKVEPHTLCETQLKIEESSDFDKSYNLGM